MTQSTNTAVRSGSLKLSGAIAAEHSLHSTKNILQNIISYINILFKSAENGNLGPTEVRHIVNYIHGLASLQDILYQDSLSGGDCKTVRIDRCFSTLLELVASQRKLAYQEIPPMTVSSRKAANLIILLIETIDLFDTDTEVTLEFSLLGLNRSMFSVIGESSKPLNPNSPGDNSNSDRSSPAWRLVNLLTKSDYKLSIDSSDTGRQEISIEFALAENSV